VERSGFGRARGISVGRAAAEGEGEDEDDRLDAEARANSRAHFYAGQRRGSVDLLGRIFRSPIGAAARVLMRNPG